VELGDGQAVHVARLERQVDEQRSLIVEALAL